MDRDSSLDIGTGSPSSECGRPTDKSSTRIARGLSNSASAYRFFVRSDKGFRLSIDGRLWLNKGANQLFDDYVDISLAAGAHTLVVESFEVVGGANIVVSRYATGAGCRRSVPRGHFKWEYLPNTGLSGTPRMVRAPLCQGTGPPTSPVVPALPATLWERLGLPRRSPARRSTPSSVP